MYVHPFGVLSDFRLKARLRDQDSLLQSVNGTLWEAVKGFSDEEVFNFVFNFHWLFINFPLAITSQFDPFGPPLLMLWLIFPSCCLLVQS
jgi:hypothetical protein